METNRGGLSSPGPGEPRDNELAGIGGNNPPDDVTILREAMAVEAAPLLERKDELLETALEFDVIGDEETSKRAADLIKGLMACRKAAEAARVARKEPFLAGERAVDGFYNTSLIGPLDKTKVNVERRLTIYQRAKADAERREREAEAQRQREEADRQRAAAEAAAAAIETPGDLSAAIAAEDQAAQAAADAAQAKRAAEVKPAELSRTRGNLGAVASLRTFWDAENIDRATLDLEALRSHLPMEALEKAVRSFIRAGGRQLTGAHIFENTSTAVR